MTAGEICIRVLGLLLLVPLTSVALSDELTLVEDGIANCVIVAPASITDLQRIAIDDFRQTIRRASGAEIPLVSAAEAADLPESTVRILLDPDLAADRLRIDSG